MLSLDTHSVINRRGDQESSLTQPHQAPSLTSLRSYACLSLCDGSLYLASAPWCKRRRHLHPPACWQHPAVLGVLPRSSDPACVRCSRSAQRSAVVLVASLCVFISSTGQQLSEGPHPLWKQQNMKSSVTSCAACDSHPTWHSRGLKHHLQGTEYLKRSSSLETFTASSKPVFSISQIFRIGNMNLDSFIFLQIICL